MAGGAGALGVEPRRHGPCVLAISQPGQKSRAEGTARLVFMRLLGGKRRGKQKRRGTLVKCSMGLLSPTRGRCDGRRDAKQGRSPIQGWGPLHSGARHGSYQHFTLWPAIDRGRKSGAGARRFVRAVSTGLREKKKQLEEFLAGCRSRCRSKRQGSPIISAGERQRKNPPEMRNLSSFYLKGRAPF